MSFDSIRVGLYKKCVISEEGEELLLKLQLPGISKPLMIKSEVVWGRKRAEDSDMRPSGMGLKFCEMTKRDKLILRQYLKAINDERLKERNVA